MKKTMILAALMGLSLLVSACEGVETKAEYPTRQMGDKDAVYGEREGLFGKGGIGLFGGKEKKQDVSGITVNAYLWRAALDTISFMPISNADPFGGTILTDWYQAPNVGTERIKANIFIMGRSLRTDALKVTLFRQVQKGGTWQDATVDPNTVTQIEDAILTRARQLRVADKEN